MAYLLVVCHWRYRGGCTRTRRATVEIKYHSAWESQRDGIPPRCTSEVPARPELIGTCEVRKTLLARSEDGLDLALKVHDGEVEPIGEVIKSAVK